MLSFIYPGRRLRKAICYEEAGQVQEALKCYDATQDALIIAKVYVSEERQVKETKSVSYSRTEADHIETARSVRVGMQVEKF
jgi:hypothetical protein